MKIFLTGLAMKVLLALICFIGMLLHSLFGYVLYVKGENIFYPEQKQIQILNKTATAFLQKVPDTIEVSPSNNTENKVEVPKVEMLQKSASIEAKSEPSLQITDTYQAPEPAMKHPEFITGWAGFLQVENAVMTFILFLLGFSICCINGRGTASRWVFGFNLVFWSTLSGAVWFFHPTNTPLNILRLTFNFPEWYFVLAASGLAALLSFILYVNAFRAPIDKKKKVSNEGGDKEPALKKEVVKDGKNGVDSKLDTPLKTAPEVKNPMEPKEKKSFGFGFDRFTKKTDKEVKPDVKKDVMAEIKSKEKTENKSEIKSEFKLVKEEIKEKKDNIKTTFDSFEKPLEKPNNDLKENKEKEIKENVKLDNKTVKEDKKPEDSVIILGDASTKNGTNKQAEVEKISEPIIPKNELNK